MSGDLNNVFLAFAGYGSRVTVADMDGKNFFKLFKDSGLINKKLTQTDIDLIFAKVKAKGARRIAFGEFQVSLGHAGTKLGMTIEEVAAAITKAGGPITTATVADAVKFHDDKALYTGVHANGGPTTVDPSKDLSGITNRKAANVRGVQ